MDGAISMGDQLNKIDTELDIWPDAERFCRAFEDIGVGMSNEDIDKAMEKFGRISHKVENGVQGTGLGLPLSSGLMALHDGLLNIDSGPGTDTTIRFCLPKERMRPSPVAPGM